MPPKNQDIDPAVESLATAVSHTLGAREPVETRFAPDGLIHFTDSEGRLVIAEAITRPSRPAVVEAWHRLLPQAEVLNAVPVLVLPQLTRSLRDLAEREGVNWVDLAGNAHIVAPLLFVHVEGKRPRRARFAAGVDPFAPRSANLVRQLLVDPQRTWRQKDLVDKTGLSQPRASKVLAALHEMALVRRDEQGNFRITDPDGLLDAWAEAYSYRRQERVPAHMSGEGIALARALGAKLDQADVTHWFTGLPAAWAYDHFARFRLVSVFVDADPELVLRDLDLRPAERGANIHVLAAGEQKLEIGHAVVERLRCVHPTQVYLDLLGLPERAREAAENLRPLALSGAQP